MEENKYYLCSKCQLPYINTCPNCLHRKELIQEILTIDFYDIQNEENPQEFQDLYISQLEQLPIEVLEKYTKEEITSEEMYDKYISKL